MTLLTIILYFFSLYVAWIFGYTYAKRQFAFRYEFTRDPLRRDR